QGDVCRLQTLGTARHFELYSGTFVQTSIALCLNRGEVYEHVFTVLPLNEAIPFGCVEPLHCTFFFHLCFLCAVMRMLLRPSSDKSKKGLRLACDGNPLKSLRNGMQESNALSIIPYHPVSKTLLFPLDRARRFVS